MPLLDAGVAYCRAAARASGSHFYYALWLLPPVRREAMFAVYSFCRAVDDVVDNGRPAAAAQAELERWRQELAACYGGSPAHPVMQALRSAVARYQIPRRYLEEILTGMAWDLAPRRYATFSALEQYCDHVAGAVGLVAIRVFGCRRPESETFARHLGMAFQLTNILRDLDEDLSRGRLYLPQEDLARFGVSEDQLARRVYDPAFVNLMAFQCARARAYLGRARAAVTPQDRWALTPALAMAAVYERLLDRLEALRYDVFSHPIRLSPAQQLWCALAGALRP